MEFEVKDVKKIEDGVHDGEITRIEYRTEPFNYTDVFIKSGDFELKVGYPSSVSVKSSLGLLLMEFGVKLEVGTKINPETILTGQKVKFQTRTNREGYAEIIKGSVKPLKLDVGI